MSDSFCADVLHFANPDPAGYRRTKAVSVTAKGSMERLAQTSDIDKTPIPCREVQRDKVACMPSARTHTHTYAFAKVGTVSICTQMHNFNAQIDNWVSGQDTAEF